MSNAISNLQAAQQRAMAGRPKAGGFPYLAETLRLAGVTHNVWFLPACESLYLTLPCTATRLGTARFRSFWRPPGAQVSFATKWISRNGS